MPSMTATTCCVLLLHLQELLNRFSRPSYTEFEGPSTITPYTPVISTAGVSVISTVDDTPLATAAAAAAAAFTAAATTAGIPVDANAGAAAAQAVMVPTALEPAAASTCAETEAAAAGAAAGVPVLSLQDRLRAYRATLEEHLNVATVR